MNLYFNIKKLVAYREEEEEEQEEEEQEQEQEEQEEEQEEEERKKEEEEESTPSSMSHRIHTCTKHTDLFNLEDVGFLQALRVRDDNAALGAG